jgi:hypothetical protein
VISRDNQSVIPLADSVSDYREKLGAFLLTGVLAAAAIPLLASGRCVETILGGLILILALLGLGRVYFPRGAYRLKFRLSQPVDLGSFVGEVMTGEEIRPYFFKTDLWDGFSSVVAANPVLIGALQQLAEKHKQGKWVLGNPRGFTYIPGDNPDQAHMVGYWGDLIVFLILRWISQESFLLFQTSSSARQTLDKAQLPVSLFDDNQILQAEDVRERQVLKASGPGTVARSYVLPKEARLSFARTPFPTISLQGRFVKLDVESRLTEVGVEDGHIFAAYTLEARVRPRFLSFLVAIWPTELQMVNDFLRDLPAYFGLL